MTSHSRRKSLRNVEFESYSNSGLWMDRYLKLQTGLDERDKDEAKKSKTALISEISNTARMPVGYRRAYEIRNHLYLEGELEASLSRVFQCLGRMVVGMGQGGVLENGITLEHTWGVPLIPGSALKGVAAAAAHKLLEDDSWRKDDPAAESAITLFGSVENAGCVQFHDAWWVPPDGDEEHISLPLHQDVITAHNKSYYQNKTSDIAPPNGTESPIPISFLSATGSYLVIVTGSKLAAEYGWLEAAMRLLELGLELLGVGAKTNAGYGRLQPVLELQDSEK